MGNPSLNNTAGEEGGGVRERSTNMTITGCTFSGNSAEIGGGGLFASGAGAGHPWLLDNCTFTNNSSNGSGGGITLRSTDTPTTISGSLFTGNTSSISGGGVHGLSARFNLVDCVCSNNSSSVGGGILLEHSKANIQDCIVDGNSATLGGGLLIFGLSTGPTSTVDNTLFMGNSADFRGGAVYNEDTNTGFTMCRFSGNSAEGAGGGIYNIFADPLISNCTFNNNIAMGAGLFEGGGAIHNDAGTPMISNTSFISNQTSSALGGAIYSEQLAPVMTNCTLVGNNPTAQPGSGLSGFLDPDEVWILTNSILWNNGSGGAESHQLFLWPLGGTEWVIDHSIIQDWTGDLGGVGNSGVDPQFVDLDGEDDIPGTEDDDLRLLPGSPGIDSGDTGAVPDDATDLDDDGDTDEPIPFDLDGNPRFIDDPLTSDIGAGECPLVDIGAYEFQDGNPNCCPADLDGDGTVRAADLAELLGNWGPCAGCPADLNHDDQVGALDLALLLGAWGPCG